MTSKGLPLFMFARHGESEANAEGILDTDPTNDGALTACGEEQARRLGAQLAHLNIDRVICTRLRRTHQTATIAIGPRKTVLNVVPDLDEIHAGIFDDGPIVSYWYWTSRHRHDERIPGGESIDQALHRYRRAFRRLLEPSAGVTLIVCHELALRYLLDAATGTSARDAAEISQAVPYLFDERTLRTAVERLENLACAA